MSPYNIFDCLSDSIQVGCHSLLIGTVGLSDGRWRLGANDGRLKAPASAPAAIKKEREEKAHHCTACTFLSSKACRVAYHLPAHSPLGLLHSEVPLCCPRRGGVIRLNSEWPPSLKVAEGWAAGGRNTCAAQETPIPPSACSCARPCLGLTLPATHTYAPH